MNDPLLQNLVLSSGIRWYIEKRILFQKRYIHIYYKKSEFQSTEFGQK